MDDVWHYVIRPFMIVVDKKNIAETCRAQHCRFAPDVRAYRDSFTCYLYPRRRRALPQAASQTALDAARNALDVCKAQTAEAKGVVDLEVARISGKTWRIQRAKTALAIFRAATSAAIAKAELPTRYTKQQTLLRPPLFEFSGWQLQEVGLKGARSGRAVHGEGP